MIVRTGFVRTCLVLCFAAASAGATAQSFADQGRAARIQALTPEVDKLYTDLAAKEHLPGVVYGIVLDGKLVHSRALGFANLEGKIAATANTQFRIASMSKSFVAMAALKLRDQGKLRLDDPVALYLPELRKVKLPTTDSPPLTVRMLMTMTTGLPEDNPWGDRQMAIGNAAIGKLVAAGLSFSNAPGHSYEYSNLGYIMLGKVVGKVSGMRFQDYVTRHILLPLGMSSTIWEYTKAPASTLALGYQWLDGAWQREPILQDGDAAAMGGLITTTNDFAKYVAFHLDAWPARDGAETGPVKRATVREMQLPRVFAGFNVKGVGPDGVAPNARVVFYGYGLTWSRDASQLVTVGHSGGLPGFGSQFRFAPEHGVGVFAFTNLRYGPVYNPTGRLLNMLVERASLPARAPVASSILLKRQQQVAQLIQSWDEKLGQEIAAENLFLDRPRQEWIKLATGKLATIGKVRAVGPITPQNRLRGTFPLVGERGSLNVTFTLTPEQEPRVQDIEIETPAATPATVTLKGNKLLALGRELASPAELFALLKASKVTAIEIVPDASDDYERIGKLIFGAQRNGLDVKVAQPGARK